MALFFLVCFHCLTQLYFVFLIAVFTHGPERLQSCRTNIKDDISSELVVNLQLEHGDTIMNYILWINESTNHRNKHISAFFCLITLLHETTLKETYSYVTSAFSPVDFFIGCVWRRDEVRQPIML